MILYDHPASSNCMKVRMLIRHLDLPVELVTLDLFRGETRTDEHRARNPDGRLPTLQLDDGATIAESGAILLYLAEGTQYLPGDPVARARVHQWMFFEQNRLEPELAVARIWKLSGRDATLGAVFTNRVERGRDSLATVELGLADGRPFLAGYEYTVADIAMYAYVHCAGDAGVDPRAFGGIAGWLDRVEAQPGFVNDLAPVPEWVSERPA